MKKIKVLRIIARLNIGGPAIHTVILAEGLDKNRFESLLVCGSTGRGEGDMLYYAHAKNITPIFIPELKRELNFFNDISAFKKIYNIIQIEKPDIIHTHTAKAGTLGRAAGILYNLFHPFSDKVRLVHTFHGHVFEGYFNSACSRFFVLIEKTMAFFTTKIITVSESVKRELIALRIAKEDKIEIIPLGFDLEPFLGVPFKCGSVLNIGIVGRLVPVKNHKLFLDAAARLIADNPELQLKFKIIGDGELREELERYSAALCIKNNVDFLGWHRDLAGIYASLDIVALTSINEGTPVSLIEAMACARTVVATDVGGVRDLLGGEVAAKTMPSTELFRVLERGVIVRPGDPVAFSYALGFILQNNAIRKNMEEKARDFVKIKFTRKRLLKDMEKLYGSLFSCHP